MAQFSDRVVKRTFIADERMTLRLILARHGNGSVGVVTSLQAGTSTYLVSIFGRRKRFFSSKLSGWLDVHAVAYLMGTGGFSRGDKIAGTSN
jgi:hypothetical protein